MQVLHLEKCVLIPGFLQLANFIQSYQTLLSTYQVIQLTLFVRVMCKMSVCAQGCISKLFVFLIMSLIGAGNSRDGGTK